MYGVFISSIMYIVHVYKATKSANKTNLVIDHKIKPWPSNSSQQSESQIKKELKAIIKDFGDERRSSIHSNVTQAQAFNEDDLSSCTW
jgi:topoisomerase-4 subunit A